MIVQTLRMMTHINSESSIPSPHETALDPHGRSSPATAAILITSPPAPAPKSPETKPDLLKPDPEDEALVPDTDATQVDLQRARSRALSRSVHEREAESEPRRRRKTPPTPADTGSIHGHVGHTGGGHTINVDVPGVDVGGNDEDEVHMGVIDVARGLLTGTSLTTTSKTTTRAKPSSAQLQLRRNGSGASSSPSTWIASSIEQSAPYLLAASGPATTTTKTTASISVVVERPCRPLPNRPKLVRRPPHVGIKERFNEMDGSLASMGLS